MKYQKAKASSTTPAHPPTAPPTVPPVFDEEAGVGEGAAIAVTAADGFVNRDMV